MKTVYKYPIIIKDFQIVEMPEGAKIIRAALDPTGCPCVWAEVQTLNEKENRELYVIGTGNPMPDYSLDYVGTINQGPFVLHIYSS